MKLSICNRAFLLIASILISCSLAVAESQPGGSDVTVPDLETKIRNSGSSVPEQALPALKAPAPVPIPEAVNAAPQQPSASPSDSAPVTKTSDAVPPEAATVPEKNNSSMTGSASLAAGLPGAVSASFSFARTGQDFPSTSVIFSHDAADGYAGETAGTGYFDRSTKIAVGVSDAVAGDSASGAAWFADVSFADRAFGFQGQSSRYFDLARRDATWSMGAQTISLGKSPFTLALTGDGSVYSSFTEGDGSFASPQPTSALADSTGYYLSPRAALSFARGNFSAELSGRYGYETASDLDELNDGEGALALRYAVLGLDLSASAGIAGDSGDGAVVPFAVGIAWGNGIASENRTDGDTRPDSSVSFAGISLREAHLSGGIDRKRVSFYSLSEAEPLAEYRGLSVYAADWNAKAGFTVAPAVAGTANAASPLSFGAGAEYRRSLAGHGTLVAADSLDSSALVAVRRTDRASLVTNAAARWDGDGFAAKTGWSLEWLDRLDRESVHSLTCGVEAFDRAKAKKWKAGVDASFALDRAEVPVLSASGAVYPVKNLSVGLSLDDAISLASGKARERNGLYMERSGSLKLSAGIYF
jgi:hypothetical protein